MYLEKIYHQNHLKKKKKRNKINIYRFLCTLKLRKNKKSHLSPANDIILITDELYDPLVHMFQQVKDYKTSDMPFSQLNMILKENENYYLRYYVSITTSLMNSRMM